MLTSYIDHNNNHHHFIVTPQFNKKTTTNISSLYREYLMLVSTIQSLQEVIGNMHIYVSMKAYKSAQCAFHIL